MSISRTILPISELRKSLAARPETGQTGQAVIGGRVVEGVAYQPVVGEVGPVYQVADPVQVDYRGGDTLGSQPFDLTAQLGETGSAPGATIVTTGAGIGPGRGAGNDAVERRFVIGGNLRQHPSTGRTRVAGPR
jgi:hypothetical protein